MFQGQLSLVLHDQDMKVRALLGVDKDGQPGFVLLDGNGKIRVRIEVEGNESRIMLLDENGKIRAQFDIEKNEPKIVLLDEDGKAAFQAPN